MMQPSSCQVRLRPVQVGLRPVLLLWLYGFYGTDHNCRYSSGAEQCSESTQSAGNKASDFRDSTQCTLYGNQCECRNQEAHAIIFFDEITAHDTEHSNQQCALWKSADQSSDQSYQYTNKLDYLAYSHYESPYASYIVVLLLSYCDSPEAARDRSLTIIGRVF